MKARIPGNNIIDLSGNSSKGFKKLLDNLEDIAKKADSPLEEIANLFIEEIVKNKEELKLNINKAGIDKLKKYVARYIKETNKINDEKISKQEIKKDMENKLGEIQVQIDKSIADEERK